MTDQPAIQIKVSAALFRAVAQCQSKEKTRYYRNGVYVQPHPEKGAVLIATDGHRMLVAHDAEGVCDKPAIIQLLPVAFEPLKKSPDASLAMTSDGIVTIGFFRSEKSTVVDGTFPDWPRVLKSILEGAKATPPVFGAASFNGEYFGSFGKIAKLLAPHGSPIVRPVVFNGSDPALILFPNAQNAFGVLMPMRSGETLLGAMPAFMQPIMEPKVAEPEAAPVAATQATARKKQVKRPVTRKPAPKLRKAKRKAA